MKRTNVKKLGMFASGTWDFHTKDPLGLVTVWTCGCWLDQSNNSFAKENAGTKQCLHSSRWQARACPNKPRAI